MAAHWRDHGRNYYSRHDYEALPADVAAAVMAGLRGRLADLPGRVVQGMTIAAADDFAYRDPVDGAVSQGQGLRVSFTDGSRLVLRLSGTGTEGATLRLYLERYVAGPEGLGEEVQAALAPVIAAAEDLARIRALTGRAAPDVVT
jgi:phosphoglucomutase